MQATRFRDRGKKLPRAFGYFTVEEAKENKNTKGKRTSDPGGVCNCLYDSGKIWKSS